MKILIVSLPCANKSETNYLIIFCFAREIKRVRMKRRIFFEMEEANLGISESASSFLQLIKKTQWTSNRLFCAHTTTHSLSWLSWAEVHLILKETLFREQKRKEKRLPFLSNHFFPNFQNKKVWKRTGHGQNKMDGDEHVPDNDKKDR